MATKHRLFHVVGIKRQENGKIVKKQFIRMTVTVKEYCALLMSGIVITTIGKKKKEIEK
jgi:hypothetical protein